MLRQEIAELDAQMAAERNLRLQQTHDAVDEEFEAKREQLQQRFDEEELQLLQRYLDDPEALEDKKVALANQRAAEFAQLQREQQVGSSVPSTVGQNQVVLSRRVIYFELLSE